MFKNSRIPLSIVLVLSLAQASAAQLTVADIYTAIRNNDLQALRNAFRGKQVEQADERGRTSLMHAAAIGTLEAMKILLAAGADPNASDSFGVTPLMFGVRDVAKARLLLEAGANANTKSKQGQTALLVAAATPESIDIVRLLVAQAADARVKGASGRNGLIVAADANDIEMVRFFLDQGVEVNGVDTTDKSGHTALMAAAAQFNAPMVRLLLQKGADANMAATDAAAVRNGPLAFKGRTALMMAAPYGSPELIRSLLDAHADVNARDIRGLTPLMFAVASENQDPEVVKMLLSSGADAKGKTIDGETALDWAGKYGSPTTMKILNGDLRSPARASQRVESFALPPNAELRSMIQASTALLQASSVQAASTGGCVSCHHQIFTAMTVAAVREKAIPVDEKAYTEQRQAMISALRGRENSYAQHMDSGGGLDSTLFTLSALEAEKYRADAITDAMAAYVMSRQLSDGRWPREEASRAPIQDGDFNRVALAVSAIQTFAPPALKAEAGSHIERARRWLLNAQPATVDDRAMLLTGLRRSEAAPARVQAAAQALLKLQGIDGGWAGNKYLESDAWATSEALTALVEAGALSSKDTAYRRGLGFLVASRQKDGSWRVRSRAPKFQPYFESGFPYGHDQWISAAATARAVAALARYAR